MEYCAACIDGEDIVIPLSGGGDIHVLDVYIDGVCRFFGDPQLETGL